MKIHMGMIEHRELSRQTERPQWNIKLRSFTTIYKLENDKEIENQESINGKFHITGNNRSMYIYNVYLNQIS